MTYKCLNFDHVYSQISGKSTQEKYLQTVSIRVCYQLPCSQMLFN
jgi:hypothetical protein